MVAAGSFFSIAIAIFSSHLLLFYLNFCSFAFCFFFTLPFSPLRQGCKGAAGAAPEVTPHHLPGHLAA